MCGIIGYVGERPVVDVLLKGLKRLEYRGYDSAGIAFFEKDKIRIDKAEGKLVNVEQIIAEANKKAKIISSCGIGHTRWATHGKPTTQNAHPHRTGHVVLVHNGIIENYQEIKAELIEKGHKPLSETDSELFGFLVLDEMESGKTLSEATRVSFNKLKGDCSIVIMSDREPGTIVGIRNGSPLVVANDPDGGVFFASDAQPIIEYTSEVIFLETGDMAIAKDGQMTIHDFNTGKKIDRPGTKLDWSADTMDMQGFPSYMLKEIFEQSRTLVDTWNAILDRTIADYPFALAKQPAVDIVKRASDFVFVACGTSWHAALLGKYWLEKWAGVRCEVELASEFRYRDPVVSPNTVVVGVTQSGETADTLAVIREMKERGIQTLAITNVRGSTISREADATFFTSAGPEIGVLATKTFSAQLAVLIAIAGFRAGSTGIQTDRLDLRMLEELFHQIIRVPHAIAGALELDGEYMKGIKEVAKRVVNAKGFFFIGRGYSFPMALEGALKLKEVAYVHAEGYAGGELKHGPLAMIDKDMVVIVVTPDDKWREKSISNLQEVKARGARILGIGNPEDKDLRSQCDEWIPLTVGQSELQTWDESLYPFFLAPSLQLFSYEIALLKGTDVDKPRNLAKSVTVE